MGIFGCPPSPGYFRKNSIFSYFELTVRCLRNYVSWYVYNVNWRLDLFVSGVLSCSVKRD